MCSFLFPKSAAKNKEFHYRNKGEFSKNLVFNSIVILSLFNEQYYTSPTGSQCGRGLRRMLCWARGNVRKAFSPLHFASELMEGHQGGSFAFCSLRDPTRSSPCWWRGRRSCDPRVPRHCAAAVRAHLSTEAAKQDQGSLLTAGMAAAGWTGSSREGWAQQRAFYLYQPE